LIKNDDIGHRFKDYESCWDFKLPKKLPMVIRVDGKCFHGLKLTKPFDSNFFEFMSEVTLKLCSQIQGAMFAYHQSDEISIIVRDDQSLNTEAWLDKRLSKIVSISAAIASSYFNESYSKYYGIQLFDSRAFCLPTLDEVCNYLIWRQKDAERNSINMLAQSLYSHAELQGKSNNDMIDLCRAKGHPWEEIPTHFKRGAIVKPILIKHYEEIYRKVWIKDYQCPIFTEDRTYIINAYDSNVVADLDNFIVRPCTQESKK
jgi:tRNA(His) 5'-end guanylyltransferase